MLGTGLNLCCKSAMQLGNVFRVLAVVLGVVLLCVAIQ